MAKVEYTVPTDPKQIKRIKDTLDNYVGEVRMMKDRQESIKEIKDFVKSELGMPVKLFVKLANAIEDEDYLAIATENSTFELLRETVLGDGGLPDDNDNDGV
jgi:translation initiation factor IF-2